MDVDQPSNPGPFVSLKDKSIYVVSPYSHVNIYKQIENLALQTSDLREKNPYSGDHEDERPVKKRKLTEELAEENNNNNNAKRRKRDLPEAIFRVIEEQEDFVPFFLRPKAYIRFKENPFAEIIDEDDTRVEYELDSDDENFLFNYNKKMETDQKEALKLTNESFEHIVDVCEKEAFKLTMDKLKENEIEAAHKVCTVCKDGSSDDNNQIIFCDGCDMAVHQACYGVRSIPEGTWFCELCDIGIGPDHPCKFCGQTGGAQKKTALPNRNDYVHVQCALWLPECYFKEDDCFGPVYYRKEIDKDRYRLQCNICNKRVGAPIQCSDKKCFASFHITCAQDKCYVLEMEESDQGVDFFAWCPKHTPPELKEKREKMIKDAEKREQSRKRAEVMKKQEEQVMLLNPKHFEHEKFCGGLELDRVKKNVKAVQPQTCSHIFRYWAEKRKRRRGLPLIKRFQPSVLKLAPPPPRLEDMSQENMIQGRKVMTSLREQLEKLRLMLDLVVKREKVKQRLAQIQTERFESVMLPENVRWRAIISALEAEDASGLFVEPVSTHVAPDYYEVIKTPISFYDIRNKISNCEYKSDEEFWADVSLIFKNAKEYNKEDTFVYEEAVRIEAAMTRAKKDLTSEQVPIIAKRAREQVEPVRKPISTKKAPEPETTNNTNITNNNNTNREDQHAMAIDDKQSVVPQVDAMNSSFADEPLTGVNTSFPLLNTANDLNMSNLDMVNDSTAVNMSLNYGKYLNNDLDDDLNGSDWAKIDADASLNIEDFLNTSATNNSNTATTANNNNNKKEDVEMRDVEDSKKNESDANNQSVEAINDNAMMTPPGSAVKKSNANKKAQTKSSPTSKSTKTPKKSTSQSDNAKQEAESTTVEKEPTTESTANKDDKEKSSKKNQATATTTNSPKSDTKSTKKVTNKKAVDTKAQSDNTNNTSQRESEAEKKDDMEVSEEKDNKKEVTNEKSTAKSSSKKSTAESSKKSTATAATPNGHVSTTSSSDKKKNSASTNKESPTKNSSDKSGSKAKTAEDKKKEPASDPSPKNTNNNNNTKTPSKSEQKKEPASEGTKSTKKSTKSQTEKTSANNESANETEKKESEEKDVQMNGVHEREPATPKKTSPKKATSSPKSTKKAEPKTSKKTDAKTEPETKTPQKKSSAKNSNKSDENKTETSPTKKTPSNSKKSEPKTPANGKSKSTT